MNKYINEREFKDIIKQLGFDPVSKDGYAMLLNTLAVGYRYMADFEEVHNCPYSATKDNNKRMLIVEQLDKSGFYKTVL